MNLGIEVDLEHLANLLAVGHVLQYNKSSDREYCGLVKGRPWLYPEEAVIILRDKMYIVTVPSIEEVQPNE